MCARARVWCDAIRWIWLPHLGNVTLSICESKSKLSSLSGYYGQKRVFAGKIDSKSHADGINGIKRRLQLWAVSPFRMVRIHDRWIKNMECDRKRVLADNRGNEARRKEKKNGGGGVSSSGKQQHDVRGKREASQHERRGLTEQEALAALVLEEALWDSKCGGGWFNICRCLPNMCGCRLDRIPVAILVGWKKRKRKINPWTELKCPKLPGYSSSNYGRLLLFILHFFCCCLDELPVCVFVCV